MSSNHKIQPEVLNLSAKPKQINRSNKAPVYSDEITEVKINSHTARLTFGVVSVDEPNSATHNVVNESITVVIPTANFLTSISQVLVPILENEQLLEVLNEDYTSMADYAKKQLDQLRSSKK